jgi:hypothetical protein
MDSVRGPVKDNSQIQPALERAPGLLHLHKLLGAQGQILGVEGVVVGVDDELAVEPLGRRAPSPGRGKAGPWGSPGGTCRSGPQLASPFGVRLVRELLQRGELCRQLSEHVMRELAI